MNAKEYLEQINELRKEVAFRKQEIKALRASMVTLSSPGFEERLIQQNAGDAPQVKLLQRIMQLEEEVKERELLLADLKAQAALMITCLDERSHRIVLEQKYLINQSYGTIANNLYVSKTTIHNWIHEAMGNLLLPENPICIYERNERNERR